MTVAAGTLAVHEVGLVSSVGLDAASSCAAFRAKLTNPTETRFMDSSGEWIMAHQVPLPVPRSGLDKLATMAAMAIREALAGVPEADRRSLPLLLCVAEAERPGRLAGLDDRLFRLIEAELGLRFSEHSAIVAQGRIGIAVALGQARALMQRFALPRILVAATDSLLSAATLGAYDEGGRLLSPVNSNGFMPGEAAGALLVGPPTGRDGELLVTGIGFGHEPAHIDSGEPLRANGLSAAIKAALSDAGRQMHDMDFRITDISGEQYYFKEAALSVSRTLRVRKEEFDLWHPAECTGESGSAAGAAIIALADAACRKGYSRGHDILAHLANDGGHRAALTLQFQGAR
jgi:3-oxoacyl-[acyl-carrier-protein] synthase-1